MVSLSVLFLMCAKKKQEEVQPGVVFQVEEMQPFTYCAIEKIGSFDQQTDAWKVFMEEVAKQAIQPGDMIGVYFSDPSVVPTDSLVWDIGAIIPDSVVIAEPLKKKSWAFTSVVTKEYQGAFSRMDSTYAELMKSIADNGYKVCGPTIEQYLTAPTPDSTGQMGGQIKIIMPVEKIQAAESAPESDTTVQPVQ